MTNKTQKQDQADQSPRQLPTFKGYTVDLMLSVFRKCPAEELSIFIPIRAEQGCIEMRSCEGQRLISEWIEAAPEQYVTELAYCGGSRDIGEELHLSGAISLLRKQGVDVEKFIEELCQMVKG